MFGLKTRTIVWGNLEENDWHKTLLDACVRVFSRPEGLRVILNLSAISISVSIHFGRLQEDRRGGSIWFLFSVDVGTCVALTVKFPVWYIKKVSRFEVALEKEEDAARP